jgi:hypothetical protein
MTLWGFLRLVAQDPILADDFLADPEAVLERLAIARDVWTVLKSGDDVAMIRAATFDL